MAKIVDVEGIGPIYAAKLLEAGIAQTETLLEQGAMPKGRKELAEKTGIAETKILEWVNHVDLYRIKGVASEYSDLLEEAGRLQRGVAGTYPLFPLLVLGEKKVEKS